MVMSTTSTAAAPTGLSISRRLEAAVREVLLRHGIPAPEHISITPSRRHAHGDASTQAFIQAFSGRAKGTAAAKAESKARTDGAQRSVGESGGRRNPEDEATRLLPDLKSACAAHGVACDDITVSAGGFVNFVLAGSTLLEEVKGYAAGGTRVQSRGAEGRPKVLVDFASPNMGKELHVGHLRSAVIGDTLARMIEAQTGEAVARISHVGDAGVPVALVVTSLLQDATPAPWVTALVERVRTEYKAAPAPRTAFDNMKRYTATIAELPSPAELSKIYESAKKLAQTGDAAFAGRLPAVLKTLQHVLATVSSSDAQLPIQLDDDAAQVFAAWLGMCEASRRGFQPLLSRLAVRVREKGESEYVWALRQLVDELLAAGVARESQGAVAIFVDGPDKPPMLLRKADGSFLYATIDMATLRYRLKEGYSRIVYVTDIAQSPHFQHLFKAARLAGWVAEDNTNRLAPGSSRVLLEHAAFGVVTGENGKRLSSRAGTELTLASLLDEGARIVKERQQQGSLGGGFVAPRAAATVDAADVFAERVSSGAIRYYELSHTRSKNYAFSYDRVLNLRGNTAVYLMYATTRLASLRRRVAAAQAKPDESSWDQLLGSGVTADASVWHDAERKLACTVTRFNESLDAACATLQPHLLAEHLFELANDFHSFYEACRVLPADGTVIDNAEMRRRLALCAAVDVVLRRGLDLLGVDIIERM